MAYDASRAFIDCFAVTPSDTARVSAFGFYVGGSGNVSIMPMGEEGKQNPTPVVFTIPPQGFFIRDIVISRFMATGTTATNIVAFGPK